MSRKTENGYMCPARIEPDTATYSGRFAVRLRRLREKAGLTHEQVAEALETTPTTVYRWEAGENFPKADILPAIASVLNVKVRALMPEA